jgi:hypothetical protein
MTCPDCKQCELKDRSADCVDTHGLDCGPYERWIEEWWECPSCGAEFEDRELDQIQAQEQDHVAA